jgi:hypothetical protein
VIAGIFIEIIINLHVYIQSLCIVIDLRCEAYNCYTKMKTIMSDIINADFLAFLQLPLHLLSDCHHIMEP